MISLCLCRKISRGFQRHTPKKCTLHPPKLFPDFSSPNVFICNNDCGFTRADGQSLRGWFVSPLFLLHDVFYDFSRSVAAMCFFLICERFSFASFLAAVVFTKEIRHGQMMAGIQAPWEFSAWMLAAKIDGLLFLVQTYKGLFPSLYLSFYAHIYVYKCICVCWHTCVFRFSL